MVKKLFLCVSLCFVVSSVFADNWSSRRNIFGGRDYRGSSGQFYRTHPNSFGGHRVFNHSNQSRQIYNTPNILNRGYSGRYSNR